MKIIKSSHLFASQSICLQLVVDLGLVDASAFRYNRDGSIVPSFDAEEDSIPAFSFEELAIGIGNVIELPGLVEDRLRPNYNDDITWRYNFLKYQRQYPSGAAAAAELLVFCINENLLKVEHINERIERKFKPV